MRFAVSLLMFVCIASLTGTILEQDGASNAYLDRFGPFWFELFDKFSLWHVYNSWWFLCVMAFLVASTSLCLTRNTPKFLRDARSFREYVRGSSLRAFPNRIDLSTTNSQEQAQESIQALLRQKGYRYRVRPDGDAVMIAAKKGSANRLGFIFAHAAIVVICIGGLLDSELPIRLQSWFLNKTPTTENTLISDIPESGRLSQRNPSFEAHLMVPEGAESSQALISYGSGVFVQPLPFSIELKRFLVDYYSTGMPSNFKSEVILTDHETGQKTEHLVEVNKPLHHRGVTLYQSSLDDGGSKMELKGYPLSGSRNRSFIVSGTVGKQSELLMGGSSKQRLELDLAELRVINVEKLGDEGSPQPSAITDHVASVTGSAAGRQDDELVNVGPSARYRLIDDNGQSREFINYMLPITLDGVPVFLSGVRTSQAEPFRYIRLPVDENNSVEEFMELRAALADPQQVDLAAKRFAGTRASNPQQEPMLAQAAQAATQAFSKQGFDGLTANVPPQDKQRVFDFALPMVQSTLAHLRDIMRERTDRPALPDFGEQAEAADKWLQVAFLALATLPDYPAPVFLTLTDFDHVQASVFQATRSPGKLIVYLGSLFLVIGVFSMFYIRDRRVWVWIRPGADQVNITAAMTSLRRNLDFSHEFNRFERAFKQLF